MVCAIEVGLPYTHIESSQRRQRQHVSDCESLALFRMAGHIQACNDACDTWQVARLLPTSPCLVQAARAKLTGRHVRQSFRPVALTQLVAFWAHLLGFFQVQGLLLGNSSSRSGFRACAVRPSRAGKLLPGITMAMHGKAARVHLHTIPNMLSCVSRNMKRFICGEGLDVLRGHLSG